MFIVDDCSTFAHFQGSTPRLSGLEGGGGVFNPFTPGVNKAGKLLFWYLSLWMESYGVTI